MCLRSVYNFTAAAMQTAVTKDSSKMALEEGLANRLRNARDRAKGDRRNTQRAEKDNQQVAGI
jgi:hypothetical protein